MKICYDNLSSLQYIGKGIWRKPGTTYYYIEKQSCKYCKLPYLTSKYYEKEFCSHSCSMIGKMVGCRNLFYGKKHDEKTIAYLSDKNSGINSPNYGKKADISTRKILSALQSGKNNSFFGKKHSEETRKIISNKMKGVNHHGWGKHLSKETKLKISKGRKGKRIGRHHPNWKGGISPERQGFYKSHEWKKACSFVWNRDEAICQRCGKKYDGVVDKFHIHHIISFEIQETRAITDNLVLLCKNCHLWVHSKMNKNMEFIKTIGG